MWLFHFAKAVAYIPWVMIYPFHVIGKENLPKDGGVVGISNHFTLTDPIQLGIYLPRPIRFLGKKELFRNWFLGGLFTRMGGISLDRENVGMSTMKSCVKILKNGEFLVLFPEGTRNQKNEELMKLKGGMALFAVMAKVPIVPMMIFKRPQKFHMNYLVVGEPIVLDQYYGKKLSEDEFAKIDEQISEVMNTLRDRVPEKAKLKYEKERPKLLARQEKVLAKREEKAKKKQMRLERKKQTIE